MVNIVQDSFEAPIIDTAIWTYDSSGVLFTDNVFDGAQSVMPVAGGRLSSVIAQFPMDSSGTQVSRIKTGTYTVFMYDSLENADSIFSIIAAFSHNIQGARRMGFAIVLETHQPRILASIPPCTTSKCTTI